MSDGLRPIRISSLHHAMKHLMFFLTPGLRTIFPLAVVKYEYDFMSSWRSSNVLSIVVICDELIGEDIGGESTCLCCSLEQSAIVHSTNNHCLMDSKNRGCCVGHVYLYSFHYNSFNCQMHHLFKINWLIVSVFHGMIAGGCCTQSLSEMHHLFIPRIIVSFKIHHLHQGDQS